MSNLKLNNLLCWMSSKAKNFSRVHATFKLGLDICFLFFLVALKTSHTNHLKRARSACVNSRLQCNRCAADLKCYVVNYLFCVVQCLRRPGKESSEHVHDFALTSCGSLMHVLEWYFSISLSRCCAAAACVLSIIWDVKSLHTNCRDLSINELSGTIPKEWATLTNLRYMYVHKI